MWHWNHAGRDVVVGQGAVDLGLSPPNVANQRVAIARSAWSTSRSDYRGHARNEQDLADYAPTDRLGEHQWYDAGIDWFLVTIPHSGRSEVAVIPGEEVPRTNGTFCILTLIQLWLRF